MKTIKGNLKLTKDTVFDESLKVEGSITGYFDLKVKGDISALDISAFNISAGNINAGNINARDINARNINAGNINAGNINAWDINALDINAWDINAGDISAGDINALDINAEGKFEASFVVCENIKVKLKSTFKNLITKRSEYEKKERPLSPPSLKTGVSRGAD